MRAWWLLALSACANDDAPSTAIAVSVKSELALSEVDYRVFRANADLGSALPLSSLTVRGDQLAQPFVVVRGEADGFLLSIDGYEDRTRPPVISYQAQVYFVPEQTMALRVLLAHVCYQRDCGFRGLTCYGQPWADIPAGTCAAIPMPELHKVTHAGEESEW